MAFTLSVGMRIAVILIAQFVALGELVDASPSAKLAVASTASAARSIADDYTGLSSLMSKALIESNISLVEVEDSGNSFTRAPLSGGRAWRVLYDSVRLPIDSRGQVSDTVVRSAVALIDSTTLQLLRVMIFPASQTSLHFPTLTWSTHQKLMSYTHEQFYGIPPDLPSLKLADCLRKSNWKRIASAKKVIIEYALYSEGGAEPTPAWVVYLWGTPPFGDSELASAVLRTASAWRKVFDATTGKGSPDFHFTYRVLDSAETE